MKFLFAATLVFALSTGSALAWDRADNIDTPFTTLDPARTALLVIDTQNDFGDPKGKHPMPDLGQVMPNLVKAIRMFREADLPIIHVVRLYEASGANADMCRRWQIEQGKLRIIVPGTWGAELVADTNPTGAKLDCEALLAGKVQTLTKNEFVIYKPRFNGFVRTPLKSFLDKLGVTGVVFVGITFPNCVRATQFGATDHDFRVGLVPDACTQVYPRGLEAQQGEGVQLMSLLDLEDFLKKK